ncbi:hypothetical protein GCM10010435_35030 [Winogradskya consettensis]|uniref:DUF4878 domain-containing protein n=1 Tax=Winogradskya consettensis TaxID=113560 RepID=A0A919SKH9_9ACTN|nr:hypothetical protein [Actinoplanes consettensis]GIM74445.1 hypothetical protein Aco04nite_40350 [Actinoplanes consettensis]
MQPPFPAPPIEGRGRRLGTSIALAIGAVLLVLGVGLAAVIGIGAVGGKALNEQADAVVADYLDAVRDRNYSDAYDMLCESARSAQSESDFTEQVSAQEPIVDYDLGDVSLVRLTVPVEVRYANGSRAELEAVLEQNTSTGRFEVCSIEE